MHIIHVSRKLPLSPFYAISLFNTFLGRAYVKIFGVKRGQGKFPMVNCRFSYGNLNRNFSYGSHHREFHNPVQKIPIQKTMKIFPIYHRPRKYGVIYTAHKL